MSGTVDLNDYYVVIYRLSPLLFLVLIFSYCHYLSIVPYTSAWISPLQSISIQYITECASLALRDPEIYTEFFNSLYFCPKSCYSFHSNVHTTLNLPNLSNYVPFESVKHRFHPFLADETWSFREHSHKQNCTRLVHLQKRARPKLRHFIGWSFRSTNTVSVEEVW